MIAAVVMIRGPSFYREEGRKGGLKEEIFCQTNILPLISPPPLLRVKGSVSCHHHRDD